MAKTKRRWSVGEATLGTSFLKPSLLPRRHSFHATNATASKIARELVLMRGSTSVAFGEGRILSIKAYLATLLPEHTGASEAFIYWQRDALFATDSMISEVLHIEESRKTSARLVSGSVFIIDRGQ